jgi:hypothetical protein
MKRILEKEEEDPLPREVWLIIVDFRLHLQWKALKKEMMRDNFSFVPCSYLEIRHYTQIQTHYLVCEIINFHWDHFQLDGLSAIIYELSIHTGYIIAKLCPVDRVIGTGRKLETGVLVVRSLIQERTLYKTIIPGNSPLLENAFNGLNLKLNNNK